MTKKGVPVEVLEKKKNEGASEDKKRDFLISWAGREFECFLKDLNHSVELSADLFRPVFSPDNFNYIVLKDGRMASLKDRGSRDFANFVFSGKIRLLVKIFDTEVRMFFVPPAIDEVFGLVKAKSFHNPAFREIIKKTPFRKENIDLGEIISLAADFGVSP